jgi:hypothetical protein
MRQTDRNQGSIKVLLIFALLLANIIVALSRHEATPGARGAAAESPRYSGQMHSAASLAEPVSP